MIVFSTSQINRLSSNLRDSTSVTTETEKARNEQIPGTARVLPNGRVVVNFPTTMPPPQVHRTFCNSWLDTSVEEAEKAEKEQIEIQRLAIPIMSLEDGPLRCPKASCKEHPGLKTVTEAFEHRGEEHGVDLKGPRSIEARWKLWDMEDSAKHAKKESADSGEELDTTNAVPIPAARTPEFIPHDMSQGGKAEILNEKSNLSLNPDERCSSPTGDQLNSAREEFHRWARVSVAYGLNSQVDS